MRKINWDAKLSDEDVAWVRQAGFMSEERIANHQAQFDAEAPDPDFPEDTVTRDALDPSTRSLDPVEGMGNGAPARVVPEDVEADEDEGDDYDQWKVGELETEVKARDDIAAERDGVSFVTVEGTGANGKVTKADLIKGLRLWDQQNPGVLSAE